MRRGATIFLRKLFLQTQMLKRTEFGCTIHGEANETERRQVQLSDLPCVDRGLPSWQRSCRQAETACLEALDVGAGSGRCGLGLVGGCRCGRGLAIVGR